MRESLTVLAALLILCLSVALVGPYFVDWNGQRDLIARQLSEALGEKVTIGGAIDLKLLPTPFLHLEDIAIKDPAGPSFTAHDLYLELAIPPLLSGKMDFIQAHIKQPIIKLRLGADGTLEGPQPQGFSGQARFERIVFEDGRIEIDDEAQSHPIVLDSLGLDAQADALTGPFKGDGTARIAGEVTGFHVSTTAYENGALRLKFVLDKSATHPRGEIEGALAIAKKPSKRFALSFNGSGTLTGFWPPEAKADQTTSLAIYRNSEIAMPWRLSGPLKVAERKAAMETLDLRLGDESASVSLTGDAALDFTANPKADLSLHATRLDLDRLLAGGTTPAPLVGTLIDAAQKAALPLNLQLSASTLAFKGEALSDLSASLAASPGQPLYLRYESGLPFRSRLLLDGHLANGPAFGFDGKLSGNTEDAARLAAWLGDLLPAATVAFIKDQPFRDIDANGDITISPVQWSAHDMSLRLDQTSVSGDLAFTPADGKTAPKLSLALNTTTLDFDKLPDLKSISSLSNGLDLSLRLDADAAKFARTQKGAAETGAVHLDLSREGQQALLKALSLKTPDGATLSAKGNWNGTSGQLDAKIDASKLDDLFKLAQRLPVDLPFDQLEPKALAPLKLELHADLAAPAQKDSLPGLASLSLKANAAATQLNAAIAKTSQGAQATLALDAPDSTALFRQFGWEVVTLSPLGAAHVEAKAPWPLGSTPTLALKANVSGAAFTFDGHVMPGALSDLSGSNVDGHISLSSKDISPLLQISGLGAGDLAHRLPADISAALGWADKRLSLGDLKGMLSTTPFSGRLALATGNGPATLTGAIDLDQSSAADLASLALGAPQPPAKANALWASSAFPPANLSLPQTSLTLRAKNFQLWPGVAAANAALQFETSPGVFGFRNMTMQLGKGTASGTLTLRRDGSQAALSGHVAIANYDLALPSLTTQASLDFDLAGSGQNALALVSSLSGSGHASFANLGVPQADPAGLERVLMDVEHDKIAVDEASINRALAAEFDKGVLQSGTLPLDIGMAAGVLRLTPTAALPDAQPLADFSLALDARSATLDERLSLRPITLPRRWQGPVPSLSLSYKGKLSNPQRMIESASFVNTMAARSIAREQARIQAYEFDLHERAVFNQRLASERKRDQERLAALEEARRVAEAARKAEEAARLEKLRKAEEAKKAEEARKRAEELHAQDQQPASQKPNALQPQRQEVPADPSTAGRY